MTEWMELSDELRDACDRRLMAVAYDTVAPLHALADVDNHDAVKVIARALMATDKERCAIYEELRQKAKESGFEGFSYSPDAEGFVAAAIFNCCLDSYGLDARTLRDSVIENFSDRSIISARIVNFASALTLMSALSKAQDIVMDGECYFGFGEENDQLLEAVLSPYEDK